MKQPVNLEFTELFINRPNYKIVIFGKTMFIYYCNRLLVHFKCSFRDISRFHVEDLYIKDLLPNHSPKAHNVYGISQYKTSFKLSIVFNGNFWDWKYNYYSPYKKE